MRGFLKFLLLFILTCCGTSAFAQVPGYTVNTFDGQYLYYSTPSGLQKQAVTPIYQSTTPSGPCSALQLVINTTNNAIAACINGSWTSVGSGQGTTPNQNVIYLSPNCGSQTNCYAVVPGGCAIDAATTSSSPAVTSASSLFLTTAHVGDIAWVMQPGAGSSGRCNDEYGAVPQPTAKTLVCSGTITSVNSNTNITLSANCSSTLTGVILYYGTNNYSAFVSACDAEPYGGTLDVAAGIYVLDNHLIGSAPACDLTTPLGIRGAGQDATLILTGPSYNHTFNFGSVFALGNLFAHSRISNLTLDGTWTPQTQTTDTPVDIMNPQFDNATLRGFAFGSSTETFYTGAYNLAGNYARNSSFEAGGGTAAFALNAGNNGYMEFTGDVFTAANDNVIEWEQASSGGFYPFRDCIIAGFNQAGGFQTLDSFSASQRDTITFTNTKITQNANVNVINMAAILQFFNSAVQCVGCSGNSTALNLLGGSAEASNSTFAGHGTGSPVATASGTSYREILSNTYTGTNNFASGTVTPPFIGGINGTAMAEGDIALSGWDTSTVTSAVGDSRRSEITITLSGTPGASNTVTITFPSPFLISPLCTLTDVGGTGALPTSIVNGAISTTSAAFTVNGTFTSGTEIFQASCS